MSGRLAGRRYLGRKIGRKTGAVGFRYERGDRTPHPDPEVARIIKENAAEMRIEQRSFTDEEILRRLLFASVNEACKIFEEGKAYRAGDIDVVCPNGFGFPRYRGGRCTGPTRSAAPRSTGQIQAWHQQYRERWAPAPLLRRRAETGTPLREAKPSQCNFAPKPRSSWPPNSLLLPHCARPYFPAGGRSARVHDSAA
jgi:3-hydroxyacyl-CoA dehydrogenase